MSGSSPFDAADPSESARAEAELEDLGFILGPREVICRECWLLHRVDVKCPEL